MEVHRAAACLDACSFVGPIRLVVITKRDDAAVVVHQHCAAVASVRYPNAAPDAQRNNRGRAIVDLRPCYTRLCDELVVRRDEHFRERLDRC